MARSRSVRIFVLRASDSRDRPCFSLAFRSVAPMSMTRPGAPVSKARASRNYRAKRRPLSPSEEQFDPFARWNLYQLAGLQDGAAHHSHEFLELGESFAAVTERMDDHGCAPCEEASGLEESRYRA